jgi:regulator of ribonuclease activity A
MNIITADICDEFPNDVKVAAPIGFRDFGGNKTFFGKIRTLKCFEDNSHVRTILNENGEGKVLVVDGGGSKRCALLGDMLAELGVKNKWEGIVIYGCIRDSAAISGLPIGVKALDTIPLKSVKKNIGEIDLIVHFADIDFVPNHYIYCDTDGIIVSEKKLV